MRLFHLLVLSCVAVKAQTINPNQIRGYGITGGQADAVWNNSTNTLTGTDNRKALRATVADALARGAFLVING